MRQETISLMPDGKGRPAAEPTPEISSDCESSRMRVTCFVRGRTQHRQALNGPVRRGFIFFHPGKTPGPLQQICQRVVQNSSTVLTAAQLIRSSR